MQLNSIIRTIKPIKIMVLSLNAHLIPWIWIILFITAHLVMKMNINDAMCQKPSPIWLHASVQCPPERQRAKSFCTRDAFMKSLTTKKLRHSRLFKLGSEAYDVLGIMLYKCIIDRRKSCFDFDEITALSLCRRFNMSV